MAKPVWRAICGGGAVALSILIAGYWAVWGTIENFHEGYLPSFGQNLTLALVQYLAWPIGFALLATLGIWKPKLGATVFVAVALALNLFLFRFQNFVGIVLILAPCVLLAVLFGIGTVPWPRIATWLVLGGPLLLMFGIGAPLAWKVSHRLDRIPMDPLVWKTSHETLVWAPPGPGWPLKGTS